MYRTLFVLMVIGTCAGVAGFTLLTPSGIAIFAAVKAKRWWCPAKSFALWIFKSQLVHKNARSSWQTTETGFDLQISHGIACASRVAKKRPILWRIVSGARRTSFL